jgi:hypothetical protein
MHNASADELSHGDGAIINLVFKQRCASRTARSGPLATPLTTRRHCHCGQKRRSSCVLIEAPVLLPPRRPHGLVAPHPNTSCQDRQSISLEDSSYSFPHYPVCGQAQPHDSTHRTSHHVVRPSRYRRFPIDYARGDTIPDRELLGNPGN